MAHSEACRDRVGAALAEDEQFQNKLQKGVKRKQQMEEEKLKSERSPVGGAPGGSGSAQVKMEAPVRDDGSSGATTQVGGASGSSGVVSAGTAARKREREDDGQGDQDLDIPEMSDQSMSPVTRKRGREEDDQGDGEREEREKQRQAISYLESMDDSEEVLDGILMEMREQAVEEVRVKADPMPVC